MDNNELINRKTSKLSASQTFIIAVLIIIGFIGYNAYDRFDTKRIGKLRHSETEVRGDKMISLLSQLVDGKINIVDKLGANIIYDKTFKASRCIILDATMHTLSVNHTGDSARQVHIRNYYTIMITNVYMDDKQSLAKYKYENKRLDGVLNRIDPNIIINNILVLMFSKRNAYQKRLDIREYLYGQFDLFYQNSQNYLEE